MNFTFGIVTSGLDERIQIVIDSIEKLNISEYEIIIIGNSSVQRDRTIIVPFNENQRPAWITKRKI